MNKDKAIELLECASQGWPTDNNEEYYKALDLGLEALKRVKEQHAWGLRHDVTYIALPGETEE